MVKILIRRLRGTGSRHHDSTTVDLSDMDVNELSDLIKRLNDVESSRTEPRQPTREEVLLAAWGNLAVEEPDLSFDEFLHAVG